MRNIYEDSQEEFCRERFFPRKSFPVDVLPISLEAIAQKMALSFNVSVDCVSAVMLAILSAAIGNAIRVRVKEGWEEPVFLWLMVVGTSGSGKTPMMSKLCEAVIDKEAASHKEYLRDMDCYELSLADYERQRKKGKDSAVAVMKPPEPLKVHYYLTDTTVEGLFDALISSPRGILMFQDELTGFINSHDQYKKSGNDRQKYLEVWSCKPLKIQRLSRKNIFIQNTGCAIVGGIQPMTLPGVFKGQSFADGFLPRFLVSRIDDSVQKFSFDVLRDRDLKPWREIVAHCYAMKLKVGDLEKIVPRQIAFSAEALKEFSEFFNRLSKRREGLSSWVEVFIPKLISYCARVSGILHVIKGGKGAAISVVTVRQACRVVEYFAGEAMALMSEYVNEKSAITYFERKCLTTVYLMVREGEKDNKIAITDIAEELNREYSPDRKTPNSVIGKTLRRLGFTTKIVEGYSYLIVDRERLERLVDGPKAPSTSSTEAGGV